MSSVDKNQPSLRWSEISSELTAAQLNIIRVNAVLSTIESTNDWALQQCRHGGNLPACCLAEHQTKGRGRKGRVWVSPQAQNIYMSLGWPFNVQINEITGLSLAAGVAVVRVLKSYGIKACLKWPNDVLVNNKKIAGILLETRANGNGKLNAVVGVGLNVDMNDSCGKPIDQSWTDVCRESSNNNVINRNQIAGQLLSELINVCEVYDESGLRAFEDEWLRYDICLGQQLDIITDDKVETGRGMGIDHNGGLCVKVNGVDKIYYSADVSVRVKNNVSY